MQGAGFVPALFVHAKKPKKPFANANGFSSSKAQRSVHRQSKLPGALLTGRRAVLPHDITYRRVAAY